MYNAEFHYTECHYVECHYVECHYVECHYAVTMLNGVKLIVIMLNVVAPLSCLLNVTIMTLLSFVNVFFDHSDALF
jgi:hypothetical protein